MNFLFEIKLINLSIIVSISETPDFNISQGMIPRTLLQGLQQGSWRSVNGPFFQLCPPHQLLNP
jgi:hypothetical protein